MKKCINIKWEDEKTCKRVLLLSILITLTIIYGIMVLNGHQYVYYDIGGGDEPEVYFPLIMSYIHKIEKGTLSIWNFSNGLGTSSSSFWHLVGNPFLLVVIIIGVFFGVKTINVMFLVMQLLNVLICGWLCFLYLKNFKMSNQARAIASYIFSFNAFIMLHCQHYIQMHFQLYLLMVVILIERLFKNESFKDFSLLIIVYLATFISTVYLGYMIAIFTFIYVLVRAAQIFSFKKYSVKALAVYMAGVIGGFLSFPVMLPYANELLNNTNRINKDSSGGIIDRVYNLLAIKYNSSELKMIFLRLLSSNLQGNGNDIQKIDGISVYDYYTMPVIGISFFFIGFVFIYYIQLFASNISLAQKINRILAGGLCTVLIFVPIGSAVFNAFVAPFSRYGYLIMPIFAIVVGVSIDNLLSKKRWPKIVMIMNCFVLFVILYNQYNYAILESNDSNLYKFVLGLGVVTFSMLAYCLLFIKKQNRTIMVLGLFVIVMANTILENYIVVNDRVFCSFSADITDEDDYETQECISYIQENDDKMYRVEKNYYDIIYFHDALIQDYFGISTYNSSINKKTQEFYNLYCNTAINWYGYNSFWYSFINVSNDIVQNSLMGVKYIISDGDKYPSDGYEEIYSSGNKRIYKNKYASGFGRLYTNVYPLSKVEGLSDIQKTELLEKAIVLPDDKIQEEGTSGNFADDVQELLDKQGMMMENEGIVMNVSGITSTTKKEVYAEIESHIPYETEIYVEFDTGNGYDEWIKYTLRGTDDGTISGAKILMPQNVNSIRITSNSSDVIIDDFRLVAGNEELFSEVSNIDVTILAENYLKTNISLDCTKYLFLPIPYDSGWIIEDNGKKIDVLQADSGFLAVKLEPGEHALVIKYELPYFKIGIVMAICGLFMYLVCFLIYKKRFIK